MIKYSSVGRIVRVEHDIFSVIFIQFCELSEGSDLFYGNTAESMGVHTLEINYNQELLEKEYLCDFTRND